MSEKDASPFGHGSTLFNEDTASKILKIYKNDSLHSQFKTSLQKTRK
jgi:hypothetical protein